MTAEGVNRQPLGNQQARIAVLVVVLLVAIGVVVWLVAFRSTNHHRRQYRAIGPKTYKSIKGLKNESLFINTKFYWAGPRDGYRYEFRRITNGFLYVRYLPQGVHNGAPGRNFLTIATYPFVGAFKALQKQAGGRQQSGPDGSIVYVRPKDHRSVLMAFPGINAQVEVYAPTPLEAKSTAMSGQVKSVR